MELVDGSSVAERLQDGPLPLPEALRLARQVAEGLAEAHRVGLVHRDLKAKNVMVTPAAGDHPGRAKILHFGLAKRLRLRPSEGTLAQSDVDQTLTRKGAVLGAVQPAAIFSREQVMHICCGMWDGIVNCFSART